MNDQIMTFSIPNMDTFIEPYTICPKEVLQKSWLDIIGKGINFCGDKRIVKSVDITDEFIFVNLD
jgi:hypothetical protein